MSELRGERREGAESKRVSAQETNVGRGIVDSTREIPSRFTSMAGSEGKEWPRKEQVKEPVDGFYSAREAKADVVLVTLHEKDLGDGLVATTAEIFVEFDPTGIVRAFKIAGTVYRAVFGSSKEGSILSKLEDAESERQDPAVSHRAILLSDDLMRSPQEAAAEAFRQHLRYIGRERVEEERKKRKKKYGKNRLGG